MINSAGNVFELVVLFDGWCLVYVDFVGIGGDLFVLDFDSV